MSHPAERRALILQAAIALMSRQGYEATTIAQVAQAAQSSIGSVTNFFDSKAELALAVRDSVAANLAQAFSAALEQDALGVPKAIESAIAAYLTWWSAAPARARLVQELASVRIEGQRSSDAVHVRLSVALMRWAAPHIEAGLLPALGSARLFALILGPAMTLTAAWSDEHPADMDGAELAQQLASHACRSLRRKAPSAGSAPAKSLGKQQKVLKGAEAAQPTRDRQLSLAGL